MIINILLIIIVAVIIIANLTIMLSVIVTLLHGTLRLQEPKMF